MPDYDYSDDADTSLGLVRATLTGAVIGFGAATVIGVAIAWNTVAGALTAARVVRQWLSGYGQVP